MLKNTNKNLETVMIADQLILEAQKAWGDGIVKIGKVFVEKGDYKAAAEEHINEFYNYQEGQVLFKPTLVSQKQFSWTLMEHFPISSVATVTIRKIMASQSSRGQPFAGRTLAPTSSETWPLRWATITSRRLKAEMMSK